MKKVLGTLAVAIGPGGGFPDDGERWQRQARLRRNLLPSLPGHDAPGRHGRQLQRHALGRRLLDRLRHLHGHAAPSSRLPHASPGRHAPGRRPLTPPHSLRSANRPTQVGRSRFGAMNALRRTTPGARPLTARTSRPRNDASSRRSALVQRPTRSVTRRRCASPRASLSERIDEQTDRIAKCRCRRRRSSRSSRCPARARDYFALY